MTKETIREYYNFREGYVRETVEVPDNFKGAGAGSDFGPYYRIYGAGEGPGPDPRVPWPIARRWFMAAEELAAEELAA